MIIAATLSAHVEQKREGPQGTKVTHQKTDFTAVCHLTYDDVPMWTPQWLQHQWEKAVEKRNVVATISSRGAVVKRWSVADVLN